MFTKAFWTAAAERMLKGAATGLVLSGVSAEPFDVLHWNWKVGLGYMLGGALASLVWSVLSAKVGPTGSPSLVADPAAAALPPAQPLNLVAQHAENMERIRTEHPDLAGKSGTWTTGGYPGGDLPQEERPPPTTPTT